jgi:predicted ester cyclase
MVRQTFEAIWNRGNLAVIDERFSSDYIDHTSPLIEGPEAGKQFVLAIRRAFSDLHYTIEDQIAEGDRVVTRWTAQGTHQGEFQGRSPTGKRVRLTGISIYRVAGGKLIEGWTKVHILEMEDGS